MSSWTLPVFSGIVGPKELADVLIAFRRFSFEGGFPGGMPPPSDEGLRTLTELAFHASLVAEEGNYSRTRLFVYRGGGWASPRVVAKFDARLPVDFEGVQTLKRLAPIADSLDSTLVLEESNEGWRCVGLATLVEELHSQEPAGVSIRIDGPGLLRVTDMGGTFVLNGGRIRGATELFYAPRIKDLLYQIDLALTQREDIPRFSGCDGRTHQLGLPILRALSRIVAKMRDGRKGGALIFPGDENTSLIEFGNFKADSTGLGDALHDFYAATQTSGTGKSPDMRFAFLRREHTDRVVLGMADCIAGLSKVDGCVVLRPNLDVVAFGAKIKVPSKPDQDRRVLTLVHPFTKNPESGSDIMRLGTRHQSAYLLCCHLPNTTAIVVSQDGDIRVFSSDAEHVYFMDGLDVSSAGFPLF